MRTWSRLASSSPTDRERDINRKFFMGLALCALSFPCLAGSVVVGADSPAGALDAEAVKRVFLGREATVGGKPAVVVYQKAGATKSAFESGVLGRSGADLAGYWSKLIFTGKAKAPEDLSGDAAVKAKVASTPGAIGYIDDGAVDGTVKVLFKF